jgi:hypothetical protein
MDDGRDQEGIEDDLQVDEMVAGVSILELSVPKGKAREAHRGQEYHGGDKRLSGVSATPNQ